MDHTPLSVASVSAAREDVDPELVALPAPPSGRRLATLTLMAAVVVAALGLAASLRHDLAYFFAPAQAVDLGDVRSIDPAELRPNSFVRLEGIPTAASTVRYTRVLTGAAYVVFPLAGQGTVYVHMPEAAAQRGRTEFAGRLVTFGQLGGRMRGVQRYLAGELELPASSSSFVVLVDETPASYGWALVLFALCLLFVAIDLALVLRWFRPTRGAAAAS
jgi:hypothetical protein